MKVITYHGRQVNDPTFSYDFVGLKDANDEEGPGFYFSTNKETAYRYAGKNGIVITVELDITRFLTKETKSKLKDIKYLVLNAPNYKESLEDWGETFQEGLRTAIENYSGLEYAVDTYQSIAYDFYKRSDDLPKYLFNMIKLGYNGHIGRQWEGEQHYIVYNNKIINILKIEQRNSLQESKNLIDSILLEYAIDLNFDKLTPVMSRYDFVQKSPKFKSIPKKLDIINVLEKYRKTSGEGLPLMTVSISRLIPTQNQIDSKRLTNVTLNKNEIEALPFVVKLDNNFYLLDGHHRVYRDKLDGKGLVKVHILDMDRL